MGVGGVSGGGSVERGISYGVVGVGWAVGRGLGCRAVREEYTPGYLMERWEGNGEGVGGGKGGKGE